MKIDGWKRKHEHAGRHLAIVGAGKNLEHCWADIVDLPSAYVELTQVHGAGHDMIEVQGRPQGALLKGELADDGVVLFSLLTLEPFGHFDCGHQVATPRELLCREAVSGFVTSAESFWKIL